MLQDTWPKPLYQTIKNYVLDHIDSGKWKSGARIPSESEIVKILGASRMTVNRAIRELSVEGRVTRIQGVGTFVAEPKPKATLLEIRSIGEEISQRGGIHSCRVILQRSEPASKSVATALNMAPNSPVFHVYMVHRENGRPMQIEDRYVNPAVAPEFLDLDFTQITPSDHLLDLLPVTEIEHKISSRLADKQECDLLQISPSEPCLELCRRSWSGNRTVTHVRMVNPGSKYNVGGRFHVSDMTHS
ncbi:histidine utilization repressor [Sneathiella sp.]|uniref:histidine utilization repressor n=1 Tax=Sneathiella sp. TaxID=1964365 RepID=UPI003569250D